MNESEKETDPPKKKIPMLSPLTAPGELPPQAGELSPSAFASRHKVSIATILDRIRSGKLEGAVRKTSTGRWLINTYKADLIFVSKSRLGKRSAQVFSQENPGDEEIIGAAKRLVDFNSSKAKEKKFQADLAEIEYKEKVGLLVEKKLVQEKLFEMARKIRNNILNIPSKLMDVLAAETEPYKVEKLLLDEIHKVLEDLSDEFN